MTWPKDALLSRGNVAAERLIEAANAAGGTDNVTVVLTRFHPA